MAKKVARQIAKTAVIREPPEISVSARNGGWIVLIDNERAGTILASKAGAETVAEWLADLFEEFGRPLVIGGRGYHVVC